MRQTVNERLYKEALAAIDNLYSDRSVSAEEAVKNLQALKDDIDLLIDTLR